MHRAAQQGVGSAADARPRASLCPPAAPVPPRPHAPPSRPRGPCLIAHRRPLVPRPGAMCPPPVLVTRTAMVPSAGLFVVQIVLALSAAAYFFLAGFFYVSRRGTLRRSGALCGLTRRRGKAARRATGNRDRLAARHGVLRARGLGRGCHAAGSLACKGRAWRGGEKQRSAARSCAIARGCRHPPQAT
jgi:hypothetical protein